MAVEMKNIGSIRTFLEVLDNIEFSDDYVYFYRGHSNFTYGLEPSIYRNDGLIDNENKIFREIILKCPDDFEDSMVTFQKLVKMQHYSLPTRLLDITDNSLTALFFASQGNTDGEVIIFKIPKDDIKYFDSDTVSVISNLSKVSSSFDISKENPSNIEGFNSFSDIKLLLHEIKQEKHFFEPKIVPKHLESVICVKPKLDNQRIIRQDGAFFLFGINKKKTKCADFPKDKIFYPNEQRLIIKLSDKKKILGQLKRFGITNSKIFPEIDNVAKEIKETFEVEKTTKEATTSQTKSSMLKNKYLGQHAEKIVLNWLQTRFNNITENRVFPDFTVNDNNEKFGYEVRFINSLKTLNLRLNDILYRSYYLMEHDEFNKVFLVLAFDEQAYNSNDIKELLEKQKNKFEKINFIVGVINNVDEFIITEEI